MKKEIKIPSMGESISEVTIGEIFKPSGSQVEADEEILEVETEKVNQVLYSPGKGKISFSVQKGDLVPVGKTIGSVETSGKDEEKEEEAPPPKKKEERAAEEKKSKKAPASSLRRTKEDFLSEVQKEEEAPPELMPPPPGRDVSRKKMSQVRRVIAQRLVEAQQKSAILTTFNEVDMSRLQAIRQEQRESFEKKYGVRLGLMSFFVKAVVSALQAYPEVHAFIEEDELVTPHFCDIGIAVGTEKGLFVPVLRRCESMTFAEIEKQIAHFADKAKKGGLAPDDMRGGSFTITNGGVYGSLLSTPLLNPPQSAILGMHTIQKRPVVVGEEIAIRPMMNLALSYDHRVIDGREAVQFLVHVKQIIEDPPHLLLEY